MSRCRHTSAMSVPGTTNTCSVKNRESVAPAMIGPPSISETIVGPGDRDAAGDRGADPEPPVRRPDRSA